MTRSAHPERIDEHGLWLTLTAPLTEPEARDARLDQLEHVFAAFAPSVRPLAVETERCWRELDTGLPAPLVPEPPIKILFASDLPPGVAVRSTVAAPAPFESAPSLDPATLRSWLAADRDERPGLSLDWLSFETLAVAVRSSEPLSELQLSQLGRATVPAFAPGWFAGPRGTEGFEVWPPLRIRLRSEDVVRLTVVVHWSLWSRTGSPELHCLERACNELIGAGWTNGDSTGTKLQ